MRENRNIYQSARELKGLTQEVAAERLDLSVESLGAYEQDRRRPPDSTVLRMAQLYDFPYLCYQHIQSGDLAGVLPQVGLYHHLRQNIDMYKASIMLSEKRKEGKVDT